jgi:hypothetical protein
MKIAGKEVNDILVIGVVVVALMFFTGYGPFAEDGAVTQTFVSSNGVTEPAVASAGILQLDSSFTSAVADSKTMADADTNYNEDTDVVSLQFDAEVSDDGVNSTFIIKTKDTVGATQTIATFTETGVLSVPTTDLTVPVTLTFGESVIGGFATTEQVLYADILASAGSLKDDSGEFYYPVITGAISTKPEVKVGGTVDSHTYAWTATTSAISPTVTFSLSWAAINKMDDISSEIQMPVEFDNGDDSKITMKIIRNTAI